MEKLEQISLGLDIGEVKTEVTFYSCQLCPRQQCEGRKARFDENLAKEYRILK
jgi:hypothetical protein